MVAQLTLALPRVGVPEQGEVLAAGAVVREVGDDGAVRVDGVALGEEVMGDLLVRDPDVDGAKDLHLIDGPVGLAPFVEFEPCCFLGYVVDAADEWKAWGLVWLVGYCIYFAAGE